MFFSQVLTAHSSNMGIDYLARKVAALLCYSNFLTTFDQDLWQALIEAVFCDDGTYNVTDYYMQRCVDCHACFSVKF